MQTEGNDICVVTGMPVRCRTDHMCRHCAGKPLSHALWLCFHKDRDAKFVPVRGRGETMYWQAHVMVAMPAEVHCEFFGEI